MLLRLVYAFGEDVSLPFLFVFAFFFVFFSPRVKCHERLGLKADVAMFVCCTRVGTLQVDEHHFATVAWAWHRFRGVCFIGHRVLSVVGALGAASEGEVAAAAAAHSCCGSPITLEAA